MRNLLALLLFVPSLCLAQAPSYVPADGLVAYYSLDEGSLGDSGLTPSQPAEWTTNRNGETNKASWFGGSQEYVTTGLSYQDFTISAWVLPDGTNSNLDICHGIVSQNADNCNALVFMATCNIPLAANFQVREQDDCAAEQVSTGLEHNMWQHLVFVREGGQIQSYRNGILEQSGPGTSTALSPDVPLRIGSMPYGGLFRGFEGGIDDVGIWNRALTEAEIQSLYLSSTPPSASLPIYAPSDGLLRWYSFDSNFADFGPFGLNGTSSATFVSDRNGTPQSAAYFNGDVFLSASGDGLPQNTEARTIAFWHMRNSFDTRQFMGYGDASCGTQFIMNFNNFDLPALSDSSHIEIQGHCLGFRTLTQLPDDSTNWQHTAWVYDGSRLEIYVNGSLTDSIESVTILNVLGSEPMLYIGVQVSNSGNDPYLIHYPWNEQLFHGALDDFAIWDRALTPSEIEGLFLSTPIESGCTDANACNYDPVANLDNGSCEYGCLYCGENTVWDTTLLACVGVSAPADTVFIEPEACAPSCGEGTVWDPVNEECIIAIPADLNNDGCVSVNDLLLLLAVHGTCPPYPEWPDEPTDTTWTCGDPVTYWNYDYATVLIGDQCWFAENLHSTLYSDGTEIPEVTDGLTWADLGTGAWCSYNNSISNSESYGLLYNWHTVNSVSGLCPSDWHVPSDAEWIILEIQLGMPEDEAIEIGIRGNQGFHMKSTSGWNSNGNGSNSSGFSGLPGGDRYNNGSFANIGDGGYWWTSTASAESEFAFYRNLSPFNNGVSRFDYYQTGGFSVRCIKD